MKSAAPSMTAVPQLSSLFSTIGTPAFVQNVLASAHELFGSDHIGVLSKDFEGRLNGCLGRSMYGQQRVVIAETNFLARVWSRDRTLFERGGGERRSEGGVSVCRRWWADIEDPEYRELCYERVGTVDRLTLQPDDDAGRLTLNFYRDRRSGAFPDDAGLRLARVGSIYLAAMARHLALQRADPGTASQELASEHDGRWGPFKLSRREFEISERICLGMTSAGIALDLAISTNTVLTYRKRIYGKLGISGQRELLALRYQHRHATSLQSSRRAIVPTVANRTSNP